MFAQELSSRLEWFEFALQLLQSNDTGDEFDTVRLELILIFALRVFGDETYGGSARIDDRILDRAGQLLSASKLPLQDTNNERTSETA